MTKPTRRERREARADRLDERADKNKTKAEAGFGKARQMDDAIPFGSRSSSVITPKAETAATGTGCIAPGSGRTRTSRRRSGSGRRRRTSERPTTGRPTRTGIVTLVGSVTYRREAVWLQLLTSRVLGVSRVDSSVTWHVDDLGFAGRVPRFDYLTRWSEPSGEENPTAIDVDGPSGRKGTE